MHVNTVRVGSSTGLSLINTRCFPPCLFVQYKIQILTKDYRETSLTRKRPPHDPTVQGLLEIQDTHRPRVLR
jgi:hypothetical protein